ncbi:fasciclin-like arabinogalactan protein 1 [Lolium perenne]|uniref:fasciclin-like arabinogalactan protein 1 n=1 Tax=Lolium perenne TaxID=4522 RepID=UPI0021F58F6B|nr:fasciclin-like arabinogalactan protein 2 [Lolium perenne]
MSLPGANSLAVLLLLVLSTWPTCPAAHNITAILAARHDMAEFSRLLTSTGLADDINERNTITVLAVDDAGMAALRARHLPREALRHVLSLHVLVDYYDRAKLHRLPGGSADVSTLFQASGDAPGSAGMVEISERRGGSVAFVPQEDGDHDAHAPAVLFVRSVHEAPYNISVLQVGAVMSSPAAEAPSSPESSPRHRATDVAHKNGTRPGDDAAADAPSRGGDGEGEGDRADGGGDRAKKNGAIGTAPGWLSFAWAFLLAIKIIVVLV